MCFPKLIYYIFQVAIRNFSQMSWNKTFEMRKAIRNFAENDGMILAECGGMIYLTEEIDGKKMCGIFPLKTSMEK